jgi:hypothetical protein
MMNVGPYVRADLSPGHSAANPDIYDQVDFAAFSSDMCGARLLLAPDYLHRAAVFENAIL